MSDDIDIYAADTESSLPLPYTDDGIKAGFPSPSYNGITDSIDLNHELIKHPASTFFGRVSGDSMIDEGIDEGDLLVIDRSLEPHNNDLAVCCIDGEFTLKRIRIDNNAVWLMPSNPRYRPIRITEENEFTVWGIVTYTIRKNRRPRR